MGNIAVAGGTGALGGAVSGAGLGFEVGGPVGALIGAGAGALVFGGASAGMAVLAEQQIKPQTRHGDLVETKMLRNAPVAVVCGRARLGGNWIAVGYFDQVKDFASNIPPGTVDYVANGILALCEGKIQAYGNFRQDGQTLTHWLLLENLPWQYLQYNAHYGSATESLFPAQSVHDNGFINLTPNPVPWRNTATLQCLVYTGPSNTTRLPDVNLDVVGPDLTVRRNGTTTDSVSGDVATDCFYDGYGECFYYTLSASSVTSSPFGMARMGRRGGNRSHIAPPSGVGSISKGWYLGRHDVLVFQDPSDSAKFHLGWWGINTASEWLTQHPSADYSHAILLSCLDERYGLLHTLHDDGTTRFIQRWNLLTGRVDRLDTDLPSGATWKSMTFSPDLGAYVLANTANLIVLSSAGETIRSETSPSTASCIGVFFAGQQIGVVNAGSVYLRDFYTGVVYGPYGDGDTDASVGALGGIISARQNTFTGHVTIVRGDGSGNPFCINFIASCVEDIRDINANGTSGTGTQAFTTPNATGAPELDFQLPGNLYSGPEPYHPPIYTGTGNVVGSTHYPPDDPNQDWCRDWSWRQYNSWNLVSLQGNSSLSAAMWNYLVDEANTDSARWGGGLNAKFFSLSSFESLHAYCVGPITIINPDLQDNRVCERFKFDHVLDSPTDLASLVSETILICCQGFHYTMGGILYVDVPRSGIWPMHHFSDRQTIADSCQINFISKADGVNRVRVVYRDVLDEYRHDYGEAEDLADINARGRVQSVEITADGCGRFSSAQLLAKQILDQSTAGRRQVTFKTHFIGLMVAPGDSIEISNVQCGLNRMPARVIMVREDASGGPAGEVEIQAIETWNTLDSLDDLPSSYAAPGDGVAELDGSTPLAITGIPGDNNITWLTNKSVYQPLTYTISYTSGSYAVSALGWKYTVRGSSAPGYAYYVVTQAPDGTINQLSVAPGVPEPVPVWATLSACQAANAGQFTTFNLTQAGPIGLMAPPGSATSPGLDEPTGLSVAQAGAAGTTTYSYMVSAVSGGGETLATQVATSAGNATLSGTNYNILTWTAVTGAASYNIYGRTLGGEMLMKNVTGTTYNDTGADVPSTTQGPPSVSTASVAGPTWTISS